MSESALADGIMTAETAIGRPLSTDEMMMVAQMVEAGKSNAAILAVFDGYERPPDVDEDGIPINRYEPVGEEGVRRI